MAGEPDELICLACERANGIKASQQNASLLGSQGPAFPKIIAYRSMQSVGTLSIPSFTSHIEAFAPATTHFLTP